MEALIRSKKEIFNYKEWLPLLEREAKKVAINHQDIEDYVQEGYLTLLKIDRDEEIDKNNIGIVLKKIEFSLKDLGYESGKNTKDKYKNYDKNYREKYKAVKQGYLLKSIEELNIKDSTPGENFNLPKIFMDFVACLRFNSYPLVRNVERFAILKLIFEDILNKLNVNQKVIILDKISGYSDNEIAVKLNISRKTIYNTLKNTKKLFKNLLI